VVSWRGARAASMNPKGRQCPLQRQRRLVRRAGPTAFPWSAGDWEGGSDSSDEPSKSMKHIGVEGGARGWTTRDGVWGWKATRAPPRDDAQVSPWGRRGSPQAETLAGRRRGHRVSWTPRPEWPPAVWLVDAGAGVAAGGWAGESAQRELTSAPRHLFRVSLDVPLSTTRLWLLVSF
jgi:hypothetical protein